jgi:hypothetical protein
VLLAQLALLAFKMSFSNLKWENLPKGKPIFRFGYLDTNQNGRSFDVYPSDLQSLHCVKIGADVRMEQHQIQWVANAHNNSLWTVSIPEAETLKEELSAAKDEIQKLKEELAAAKAELEAPKIAAAEAKAALEKDLMSIFG